ncbi:uncharacterized protein LOC114352745 isoform X1 [Ostrinia furnacalis]|uniref:uncharacterized protein LOC114352745 isoform X1 n=1 Tax=Ostrinia furnacalis TaxID=93504 RepID=UPI00103A3DC5|nr:uncharacterized protein LOC114352745 isoform X1 [Ostrinia furnacalis]
MSASLHRDGQSDRSRVERPTRPDAATDSTACRPPTLIDITVPHMHAFIATLCVANRSCEVCSRFENINVRFAKAAVCVDAASVPAGEVGRGARASLRDAPVIARSLPVQPCAP